MQEASVSEREHDKASKGHSQVWRRIVPTVTTSEKSKASEEELELLVAVVMFCLIVALKAVSAETRETSMSGEPAVRR